MSAAIQTIDPTTGERLECYDYMDRQAIAKRLDAATAAGRTWSQSGLDERAAVLRAVAGVLRDRREQLAGIAVREMGKPIVQARAEVEKCAWCADYFAEHAAAMLEPQPVVTNARRSYVAFRPLGTILAIMPWNFPYWQVFRAAIPALLAGNPMVLKHAENTTLCGLEIEGIFAKAGAPEGLFATLLMSNETTDELIADSRIAAVTLTGSERAGVAVAAAAGASLKKCVLELGGSDAFVVLADADLEATAAAAAGARFQNNGQSCIAAKRFIAVPEAYDAFLERFVANVRTLEVGDPAVESTAVGPCARADLRAGLIGQVKATVAAGAKLECGGSSPPGGGFFYAPTIVSDVRPGMAMFEEETFGPAAAVVRARDQAHALELANASKYGLGFSLWTADSERAESIAREVEAGAVFVNGIVASDPRLPFGGIKRSGYGRELSAFGLHEFTNIQAVWIGKP